MLWVALIAAITIKSALLYFYALVDGDKGLQALAAISITNGNGYTIPEFDLLTNQVKYLPLVEWPPLYSLLLAPLLVITGNNVEISCYLLDVMAGITLLIFLLLLLRKMGFPAWLQALFLVFEAAELNATALISFPTDTWATAAVFAAVYFLLRAIEKPGPGRFLIFALINVLPFYFRYMYLPVVLILPALYAWQYFHQIQFRRYIVITGLITIGGVLLLLFFNWYVSSEAIFLVTTNRGFYPETLKTLVPVFWASFINIDFYCMQVSLHTPLSYKVFHDLLKVTGTLVLLLLIIQYVRHFKILTRSAVRIHQFFLYAGALSLFIIIFLVILSLTHSPYSVYHAGDFWTYVMEERYFAVPSLLILIVAGWWLFIFKSSNGSLQKTGRMLFFLIAAIEIGHALHIIYKKSNTNPQHYSAYIYANEQRKDLLKKLVAEERKKGMDIVLVSDQYGYIMQGAMEKIKVSRNVAALKNELAFPRPTILLFVIPAERAAYFSDVIQKHRFELIPVSENYFLYKSYFLPP